MVSPTYGMKDKPTPMTSNVPRVKCLSSVVLNQKTFAVGLGVYVMVYLYAGLVDSLSTIIGGASLGALALQASGHA